MYVDRTSSFINFPEIIPELKEFSSNSNSDISTLRGQKEEEYNTNSNWKEVYSALNKIIENLEQQGQEQPPKIEINNQSQRSEAIELLTAKLGGRYSPKVIQTFVDRIGSICEKELTDVWSAKRNDLVWKKDRRGIWVQTERTEKFSVLWSPRKDGQHTEHKIHYDKFNQRHVVTVQVYDDNYGENKKRNDSIQKIRNKQMRKSRKYRDEHLGDLEYKNDPYRKQFLQEVEDAGLVKKEEQQSKPTHNEITEYQYNNGFRSALNRNQGDEL